MPRRVLKNKPLVEAIFELRLGLEEVEPGVKRDPGYRILIGRMYERLEADYPFHEELPTARIPDEVGAYVVQHRFRRGEGDWPLVQLGPGILAVNDTGGYLWEDFQQRIASALDALVEAHPRGDELVPTRLLLRYIDSVPFDWDADNALGFLEDKLKVRAGLHPPLFESTGVAEWPSHLDLQFRFGCDRPDGSVIVRFARGQTQDEPALIWETMVQTDDPRIAIDREAILRWVTEAHDLSDDWFFKMIAGDLERRFE